MSDETTRRDDAGNGKPPHQNGILADAVEAFNCRACGTAIHVKGLPAFSSVQCPGCGAETTVPVKLGSFLLMRLIGTGGMGGVYFARDEQLGRDVAIKVMLQSLGEDPQFIETFRHEAQAVAKLNHANIAQIYSFGQEKGQPYIVMELVSGERVDELMERPGGITKILALRIGLEIAQGLSAADEAGLVHGDIKPENILLDRKGNAKLVDFGLATVAHQNAGEGIWGTPYYIAPEKIRRQKLDARSDIYSLGATLYHMLTGQPPFDGETPVEVVKARLDAVPPDPREIDPDLPPIVGELILRMLAPERTERYPNYRSLISDLRKALQTYEAATTSKIPALSSGKSIRIKKRGANAKAPTGSNKDAAATGAGGPKLVIRKPGGAGAKIKGTFNTPAMTKQDEERDEAERAAKRERRKRRAKRIRTINLVIFALLLSSGIAYAIWRFRSDQLAEQRELHQRREMQLQAVDLVAEITTNRDRIDRTLAQVRPLVETVRETAERMNITVILPPEEPPVEQDPPETVPEDEPQDTAPEDEPQEAEPADPDKAVETEIPEERPAAPRDTPESNLVRDALSKYRSIETLAEQTRQTEQEAQTRLNRLTEGMSLSESRTQLDTIKDLHQQSGNALASAQRQARELQGTSTRLAELRQRFDVAEQRRLDAERAAQRLADQRAAEERARQELEQLVRRELARIPGLERGIRNLLDQNAFTEAYAQLQERVNDFTTDEGKEAFRQVLERYRYLAAMKANIIRGIEVAPFPWGYGFGATARDISGASLLGLQIHGTRTPVPWASVSPPQMLKFVDRYIESRDITARERIEIAFGAAFYVDLFGEAGRERARFYANRALDMGLDRRTFEQLLEARWVAALGQNAGNQDE